MINKGKILAVDFGEKKVGLAVCDAALGVVFPRGVIKNYGSLEVLFNKLKTFCVKEEVKRVIFGVPLSATGGKTAQTLKITKVAEDFGKMVPGLEIELVDESFSTHEGKKLLTAMPKQLKKGGRDDDDFAAVMILEKFLKTNEDFKKED